MPRRHLRQLGNIRTSSPPRSEDEPGIHGYPRPQLRRREWQCLNGPWEFEIDPDARWTHPKDVPFSMSIVVPFSPETLDSGIGDTSLFRACWYRRTVAIEPVVEGRRTILHFGAVDYEATVWINGHYAGRHEGGYTPFEIDITEFSTDSTQLTIVVRAFDDPADLCKPRGKQDWQLTPHSIWYPRTSGIWQTVWLESVPQAHVQSIFWTPDLSRWEVGLNVRISELAPDGLRLGVRLTLGSMQLADDVYSVVAGEVHRRIALSDPGIDDFRNELLWSPETPKLIEAEITLMDANGPIDTVRTYTALRAVSIQGDRFVLNGRPFHLRMVLDQGYWEGSGLSAPSDEAIRRDVELAKAMGFNAVRKHQKIEDPRYLFWADTLGLLVWEEMPSAYRFTRQTTRRFTQQWTDAIRRDYSHPCIVAWVPFNESWGVPNLVDSPMELNYVKAIYYLTKSLDPTRPVIGNDGWESSVTDIIGIHDYDTDAARVAKRYQAHDVLPTLFQRERPGGRVLLLEGQRTAEMPIVLTEFGGIAFATAGGLENSWGYSMVASAEAFAERYRDLLRAVASAQLLSGFCYTQFADTYQEKNGLLKSDRTPKVSLDLIREATRAQQPGEGGFPVGPPILRRDEGIP